MESDGLERVVVPALDAILGRRFDVLDDGYVRVIDYMGSDEAIVQAARVSYGAGTKTVHEDAGLIRYLMRHHHTTPFEMCEIKMHVRVPMDAWRQWIRHRTANVNEYSTRYSIAIDAMAATASGEWRKQSRVSKQGSEGNLGRDIGEKLSESESVLHRRAREVYEERLAEGVAREQARKDLPLATYTEAYWKIDLHNLLHFLELRLAKHAQLEIRKYAEVIAHEVVARWCPVAWAAFEDYALDGMRLSARELAITRALASGDVEVALKHAEEFGWIGRDERGLRPNRERSEAEEKLSSLGYAMPWK